MHNSEVEPIISNIHTIVVLLQIMICETSWFKRSTKVGKSVHMKE